MEAEVVMKAMTLLIPQAQRDLWPVPLADLYTEKSTHSSSSRRTLNELIGRAGGVTRKEDYGDVPAVYVSDSATS
jgi:hypothetical protein